MTRKKFRAIVRFSKRAHEHYKNDILTPLERRRKAISMSEKNTKALTAEKISEVKKLIEDGESIAKTAEQTGVSKSSVCRIKSGHIAAKKPTEPTKLPEPKYTILEAVPDVPTTREIEALKALIGQAVKAFAGIECATAADSYNLGQTFGLLTAAQMILEGET